MKEYKEEDAKKGKEDDAKNKKALEKKEEKVKVSAKQEEILKKQIAEKEQKMKEYDQNQLKQWEPAAEALGEVMDLDKLEKELLDLTLGYNRITDSFVGIKNIADT